MAVQRDGSLRIYTAQLKFPLMLTFRSISLAKTKLQRSLQTRLSTSFYRNSNSHVSSHSIFKPITYSKMLPDIPSFPICFQLLFSCIYTACQFWTGNQNTLSWKNIYLGRKIPINDRSFYRFCSKFIFWKRVLAACSSSCTYIMSTSFSLFTM